jgi:ethanolamine utilization protein EutQ (cupin superfamily)
VPASTVALNNPFSSACLVTLRGGTVSAVAVGGTALSIAGSLVLVPAGSSITLTYAVAPTWTWYAVP